MLHSAHKCNDLSRGHFVCQCEDGFDGMSCDHDCSSKNAPLTVDLKEDSFGSSTFIPTYEPFQARWNQGLGYFHVPTGGFPNVWKPQTDDTAPYLWIDLGERRTVFSMAIRSGRVNESLKIIGSNKLTSGRKLITGYHKGNLW